MLEETEKQVDVDHKALAPGLYVVKTVRTTGCDDEGQLWAIWTGGEWVGPRGERLPPERIRHYRVPELLLPRVPMGSVTLSARYASLPPLDWDY